jgi:hypothetical protein
MKYDQKMMSAMADDLENYLDIVDRYVIIDGITEEEYNESVKTVKKLIKNLRKGNGDKVFNKERYIELKTQGALDDIQ